MPNVEAAIASSARLILDEIGDPPDLTLVHGADEELEELSLAGARSLLSELIYREIDLDGLCAARGHTALLSVGEGFCRPHNGLMTRALAVASMRFDRVIVLPASFDPSDDGVRHALRCARATFFAREPESYRRIVSLCDARLAHDCAFFFDFKPWRKAGNGRLDAVGSTPELKLTLEQWLTRVASHELIRTDRVPLVIAGALLGKQVEFTPGADHGLGPLAEHALAGYPIRAGDPTADPPSPVPARTTRQREGTAGGRVDVVILSHRRARDALRAVDSLALNDTDARTIVVDNNSSPAAARVLAEGCRARASTVLLRHDRDLGCAGGRRAALEQCGGEYVLFLDDDAVLEEGALDLLLAELDAHPAVAGVSTTVLLPDGSVQHSGGWLRDSEEVAEFGLLGAGERNPAALAPSGPADWIPGGAALFRRATFAEFPLDPRMNAYFEDNEWCYRVERVRPDSFRRSREARAVHHQLLHNGSGVDFRSRSRAVDVLTGSAFFYRRHGKLLDGALFDFVPGLRDVYGGKDYAAARLLMELLDARGADWVFMQWMNGELGSLVGYGQILTTLRTHMTELEELLAQRDRTIERQQRAVGYLEVRDMQLTRIEQGGWWRLRGRLLPLLPLLPLLALLGRLRGTVRR